MRRRALIRAAALAAAAVALFGAAGAAQASVGQFAMALQPDGKILVAGGSGPRGVAGKEVAAVARYLPDGSLDRGFGGGDGVFLAPDLEPFTAIALQRDGRIVLAARGEVVRLLPRGSFDANFGLRGRKAAGVESSWYPTSIAVAGDGDIFVAGLTGYLSDPGEAWYGRLYRIAPSGLAGGWVGSMTSGDGREGEPKTVVNDILLGPGGSVIGAGTAAERRLGAREHGALARLLPGTVERGYPSGPDPSFGGGAGLVTTNFLPASPASEAANGLARQDGKLLIAGQANTDLLVARYGADGILDHGFGRRGFWTATVGRGSNDVANALAVDAKGGIFAAGGSEHRCGGGAECTSLLLARFGKDGGLAKGFGRGGLVTPALGSGAAGHPAFEVAYDLALWRGRVLVGGLVGGPSSQRFFLRRYRADGAPDPSFGERGRVTTLPAAADRPR
jgi:uncharacterized delta-60 repeat protein